ncbi:MAG: nucleotidyl transferase AbiEii/AbiGii toxin family protein [Bacteroidota bacterium]
MMKDWIAEYNPQNEEETLAAMREIMQEIALAALSRTDFFKKAAFYGGTALRIFHGLDRYSEDLDFSLLETDPSFSLTPYFSAITDEFEALGIRVSIREKDKRVKTPIESAFLKSETLWQELVLEDVVVQHGISSNKSVKIKIEIDRVPPLEFETEEKLLVKPFSFYVNCFSLPSLFAGKLHALLFRKWKNRVKGRDWYDMEWYIRKGIPLNVPHFLVRAIETNDWQEMTISKEQILELFRGKINSVSFDAVKDDVRKFIRNDEQLKIWNANYFNDLIERMKFSE